MYVGTTGFIPSSQIIWFEEDLIDRDDCNDFEER